MASSPRKLSDRIKSLELHNPLHNVRIPTSPSKTSGPGLPQPSRKKSQSSMPQGPNVAGPRTGQYPPPAAGPQGHKRTTSVELAKQYDLDKQQIIRHCFSKMDNDRTLVESYISHVRIIEDSHYPSNPPPSGVQSTGHLKPRILMLGVKKSGRVRIHKGRENNGTGVQIGRTWDLDELTKVERLPAESSFMLTLGKTYYWQTSSPMETHVFLRTLLSTYMKYTGGKLPETINIDLNKMNLGRVNSTKSVTSGNSAGYEVTSAVPPPTQPKPSPQLLKTKSLKKKNLPEQLLPSQPTVPFTPPPQPQVKTTPLQVEIPGQGGVSSQEKLENYKNIDFTVNGKLPMKPMSPMSVDRPTAIESESLDSTVKAMESPSSLNETNHTYSTAPSLSSKASTGQFFFNPQMPASGSNPVTPISAIANVDFTPSRDTPKSVNPYEQFKAAEAVDEQQHSTDVDDDDDQEMEDSINKLGNELNDLKILSERKPAESIHEYAQQLRAQDPKPEISNQIPEALLPDIRGGLDLPKIRSARKVSEPLEVVAALGAQLEDKLAVPQMAPPRPMSPDFGIEEVSDSEDEEPIRALAPASRGTTTAATIDTGDVPSRLSEQPLQPLRFPGNRLPETNRTGIESASISSVEDEVIDNLAHDDSRIYEEIVTKRMSLNEQLGKDGPDPQDYSYVDYSNGGYSFESEQPQLQGFPTILPEDSGSISSAGYKFDKDTDFEEIFDEIQWSSKDTASSIIEKLGKELNNLKYDNVKELISLNNHLYSVGNEVTTSIKGIHDLGIHFKNVNLDFKFIAGEINDIENGSQGLQVSSVNKKKLYNNLKEILNKININNDDLKYISRFQDFNNYDKLILLEEKLVQFYSALETISDAKDDDLSSMEALKQYRSNYEAITQSFIDNFKQFIHGRFEQSIATFFDNIGQFDPRILKNEFEKYYLYSGFFYFINDITRGAGSAEIIKYFINRIGAFYESLIISQLKNVSFPSNNNFNLNSAREIEPSNSQHGLRKSNTIRTVDKRDKIREKLGLLDDVPPLSPSPSSSPVINRHASLSGGIGSEESTESVINIMKQTKEIVSYHQEFMLKFFHINTGGDIYSEYVLKFPISRSGEVDYSLMNFDTKRNYTTDMLTAMGASFGGYLNNFFKEINPNAINLPIILIGLDNLSNDILTRDEFLSSKFLRKANEKFKSSWIRFIDNQVNIINKSSISTKGGVSRTFKNYTQLIFLIESSLRGTNNTDSRITPNIRKILDDSYQKLTAGAVSLLGRNDPLLKDTDFDEKQKLYHNVSLIQNLYYLLEELLDFNVQSIVTMKSTFRKLLNEQLGMYFTKIINKPMGKLTEFIENIESLTKENISLNISKSKVYSKSSTKKLLINYDSKEIRVKVEELYKKLEKHFSLERGLIDKIWGDLRNQFIEIFNRLNSILTNHYRDIDYHVGRQDIIFIFNSIHQ